MARVSLAEVVRIGTAGWAVPRELAPATQEGQSALERYAQHYDAVEINSTFYRLPLARTVERWRDTTPSRFRFTVKVPQAITHESGLVGGRLDLRKFCKLIDGFGSKLGAVLVQLPPSLTFDAGPAGRFFAALNAVREAPVVVEPRHATWFSERADALLRRHGVERAAADPARHPAAGDPTFTGDVTYFRWHGSPRMYFSVYEPERIVAFASRIRELTRAHPRRSVYCIFDNTGLGAAPVNALELRRALALPAGAGDAGAPPMARQIRERRRD
jgi:uncharacterized protein YecE (DUF72 family)